MKYLQGINNLICSSAPEDVVYIAEFEVTRCVKIDRME